MTARAWVLFVLSSVIWGMPYLFIKIAVDADVPPAFVAWSRIALAAALLLPLAIRRKALRGLPDRASAIIAYTASEVAVPFVLIAIGEQYSARRLPRFWWQRCRSWLGCSRCVSYPASA